MKDKTVTAIVLAAGIGRRMGGAVPKQFMDLAGRPVLYYSLKAFELSDTDRIILVTGEDSIDYCRKEVVEKYGFKKVTSIIAGGKERYDSVNNGLSAAEGSDYVLIHDGARPLVDRHLINDCIKAVIHDGPCISAVKSKDTVKIGSEDGYVESTPDRARVWIVQTPQCFPYELIKTAYQEREKADDPSVTDDAMVVEKYAGVKIKLLEGDYRNIKITTPEDIALALRFLDEKNNSEI